MTEIVYAEAWNTSLRQPLGDGVEWDSETAAETYRTGGSSLAVVEKGPDGGAAPWLIEVGSGTRPPRIDVQRFDETGSIVLRADFRPIDGRLFCDRVISWTYPAHDTELLRRDAEAVATTTYEPDGTGTLELRDKTVPGPGIVMDARDIPVDDNWVDVPEFGQWQTLLDAVERVNSRPTATS